MYKESAADHLSIVFFFVFFFKFLHRQLSFRLGEEEEKEKAFTACLMSQTLK